MKKLLLTLFLIFSIGFNSAWAIDLGSAKSQGLVGETPQGYLAAVGNPSAEVKSLIKNINSQRKKQFDAIAKKNGTSLEAVEQMAGKTAINKTSPGNFVQINGAWKKK
jgi:uncharacterized protein YdbL (DUF1318 family)